MTKLLCFSDLHCHNHTQFSTVLSNGRNSRLQDCLNIIHQAKDVAVSEKCDAVLFLGDLLHSRSKLDIDVLVATWLAVRDLSQAVPTYLLKGNHDSHNKVGDVHSLEAFKPLCEVIDAPRSFFVGNCHIQAFPYTPDTESLVRDIAGASGDVLLLHQAFREGAVGVYGHTGHGEMSLQDIPFDRWKYVLAGDFHKKQQHVGGRFRYLGSPLQLTFGEAGEPKCFSLLNTDDWSITEIPTSAPRFFVYDTPADYLDAKEAGLVRPEIDFIRVLYDEQHRDAAEVVKADCSRVQVVEESQQKAVLQRIGNEVASSDTLLLEAYIEQKAGPLDKDRLLSIGLEELCGETV